MLLAGTCGPPSVGARDAALEEFPNPRMLGPAMAAAPPTRPAVRRNSRRFILPYWLPKRVYSYRSRECARPDRSRERVDGLSSLVRPLAEVLDGAVEVDHDEQPFGFGGDAPVDRERPAGDDAPTVDLVGPAFEFHRTVQRGRAAVPDAQPSRHPRMAAGDVRHAEDLVEAERDPSTVHVAGRALVGGVEDAPAEQPAVAVLVLDRRRERAHDTDEGAARQVVVVRFLLAGTHARRAGAPLTPTVPGGRGPLHPLCGRRQ